MPLRSISALPSALRLLPSSCSQKQVDLGLVRAIWRAFVSSCVREGHANLNGGEWSSDAGLLLDRRRRRRRSVCAPGAPPWLIRNQRAREPSMGNARVVQRVYGDALPQAQHAYNQARYEFEWQCHALRELITRGTFVFVRSAHTSAGRPTRVQGSRMRLASIARSSRQYRKQPDKWIRTPQGYYLIGRTLT